MKNPFVKLLVGSMVIIGFMFVASYAFKTAQKTRQLEQKWAQER